MKRTSLALAAALAAAFAVPAASAQERGYRQDSGSTEKHYRRDGTRDGARGDGHRGFRHDAPRYHYAPGYHYAPRYWSAPYYRPYRYFYDPYWYAPPLVAAPYPWYDPEPVIVERYYEPPRYEYAPEPEPPRPFRERSYSQLEPAKPAAPAPAVPAPRLERYTLSARELFEFDKAVLRLPQPKLDEIAEAMKRNPNIDNVTITGYTDRLGTEAYNLALSMRRANAVKSYLVGKGVAASRLRAVGKGEANPVADCPGTKATPELIRCLEPNRRVEVEQITVERTAPAR
jgi:outer membrane protein OmpA-like peptidoglycan-associated protein